MINLSVINSSETLYNAIESVYRQRCEDMELLLIYDGSDDDVCEIGVKCCYKKNFQVRWFRKPHEGVSAARNFGLRRAYGKYIWFIDADDLATDNAIVKETWGRFRCFFQCL